MAQAASNKTAGKSHRPLLSLTAAAAYVGCHRKWLVRNAIEQKKIPYVKLNRLIYFAPDDLDELIAASRVAPRDTVRSNGRAKRKK